MGVAIARRKQRCLQAVAGIIGEFDCCLIGIHCHNGEHRAKYLFFRDGHFGRDSVKYSRFDEEAVVGFDGITTPYQFGAFFGC